MEATAETSTFAFRSPQGTIFEDIVTERCRQDAKFGADRDQSGFIWSTILSEEVGEAAKEVLEENVTSLRYELVQVAAVAVAWIEAIDAGRLG